MRAPIGRLIAALAGVAAGIGILLVLYVLSASQAQGLGPWHNALIGFAVTLLVLGGIGLVIEAVEFTRWLRGRNRAERGLPFQAPVDAIDLQTALRRERLLSPPSSPRDTEEPFPEQVKRVFEVENIASQQVTVCGDYVVTLREVMPPLIETLARWTRESEVKRKLHEAFPRPADAADWALTELSYGDFVDRVLRTFKRLGLADESEHAQSPVYSLSGSVQATSFYMFRWTPKGQAIANQLAEESTQAHPDAPLRGAVGTMASLSVRQSFDGSRIHTYRFDTAVRPGQRIPLPWKATALRLLKPQGRGQPRLVRATDSLPTEVPFHGGRLIVHAFLDDGIEVEVHPIERVFSLELEVWEPVTP